MSGGDDSDSDPEDASSPSSSSSRRRSKWLFGLWSVTLSVLCLVLGLLVGQNLSTINEEFGTNFGDGETTLSSGRVVQTVDLTETMELVRRAAEGEAEKVGGAELRGLALDDEPAVRRRRLALKHNTAYYDTIQSLTVTKETGWLYTFRVGSYKILPDTTLLFFGTNGEELKYPADGSGWKLAGGEAAFRNVETKSASPSSEDFGPPAPTRRGLVSDSDSDLSSSSSSSSSSSRLLAATAGGTPKSSLCDSAVASNCKTCIEAEDTYCKGTAWDDWCTQGCAGPTKYMKKGCKSECAEPRIVSVAGKTTAEVQKAPPVHCAVSPFSLVANSCSFSNGSDKCSAKRSRSILTMPQNGGDPCPALEEQVECPCPAVCGDGRQVSPESCDDGNARSGDGCSDSCGAEQGWSCGGGNAFTASRCVAASCGDGVRTGAEQCDDGNRNPFDGCDASCNAEPYFQCSGAVGTKTACKCMRVRKDWRDLRADEKALYFEAVQALKTSGQYDLFVQTHSHNPNKAYAHGSSGFLPWHRKYLLEFENALRDQNAKFACVTIPYWDWAQDTDVCGANGGCKAFHSSSVTLQEFGGPGSPVCMTAPSGGAIDCSKLPDGPWTFDASGKKTATGQWRLQCAQLCGSGTKATMGSTGAKAKACTDDQMRFDGCVPIPAEAVGCVLSGPFAGWMSPEWGENPAKTCLTRGLNWEIASQGYLTASLRMQEIITTYKHYGNTAGFRAYLESTPHANPHNLLGGHIRSFSSPADPLFFSHHAFIDRIWSIWQDCFEYDAMSLSSIGTPQYESSTGVQTFDGWDNALVFKFPAALGPGGVVDNKCLKSVAACSTCVNTQDSWCASNAWDSQCAAFCLSKCAASCASSSGAERTPDAVIPGWDTARTKPKDYHTIHDLGNSQKTGKPNSYMYAKDEFDAMMQKNTAICKLAETAFHGKQWKTTEAKHFGVKHVPANGAHKRKLDENGRQIKDEYERIRDMYKLHDQEPPRRILSVEYDDYGCPFDTEGTWSSSAYDNDGDGYCDSTVIEDPDSGIEIEVCACRCDDGFMWDIDQTYCHSIYAPLGEADPDTVASFEYFEKLAGKLIENSIFVKDSDSLVDVFPKLVDRECELLYNKKSNVTRIDDVLDADSKMGRFLRGWGLGASVDQGVANDPCNGHGPTKDEFAVKESQRRYHQKY